MKDFSASYQDGMGQIGTVAYQSACNAPTNVVAVLNGNNSVTLTWSAAAIGGTSFQLDYKPNVSTNWITISNISGNNQTIPAADLTPGTLYNFRVRRVCGAATYSDSTNGNNITTAYTECVTITGLTATPDFFSVELEWTGTSNEQSYAVYVNDVLVEDGITAHTYTVEDLQDNTNYTFKVIKTCLGSATAPPSTISSTTLEYNCIAPTNLVLNKTSNTITGTWTAVAGSLGYGYSINGGAYNFVANPTFSAGGTPSTLYTVSVVTYCQNSEISTAVSGNVTTNP